MSNGIALLSAYLDHESKISRAAATTTAREEEEG
jgi:hypothetical protein